MSKSLSGEHPDCQRDRGDKQEQEARLRHAAPEQHQANEEAQRLDNGLDGPQRDDAAIAPKAHEGCREVITARVVGREIPQRDLPDHDPLHPVPKEAFVGEAKSLIALPEE